MIAHENERSPESDTWLLVVALTACAVTFVALAMLWFAMVDNLAESAAWGFWSCWVAVIPAWLAYAWFDQGHDVHGTVAYWLGVALTITGLIVVF